MFPRFGAQTTKKLELVFIEIGTIVGRTGLELEENSGVLFWSW